MDALFDRREAQKKKSTVDIVIEHFRYLLMNKLLLPGQRIPSEAEISEGLGVSRGSVREAMKILSAFGVVDIKVGDGTYIPSEPKSAIIEPLLFSFLIYNPQIEELSEFRRLIELDIVELVIEHKCENESHRNALLDNLKEMEQLRDNHATPEEFAANDIAFHRLLGKACCNRLAQKIYDFVLDFLENTIAGTHQNQQRGELAYKVHSMIIEAIYANNLELAKQAIFHSVDVWEELQNQTI